MFEDTKFREFQKFAINRVFKNSSEDEKVVTSRIRWSYDFKDKYFQGSVKYTKSSKFCIFVSCSSYSIPNQCQ